MKKRITKKAIDALKSGETIWDDRVSGFGARKQKDAVSYIVKKKVHGRQHFVTIGRHGSPWMPELARKEAIAIIEQLNRGIDPNEAKRRERAKKTFDEIWAHFDEAHIAKLKPRTQEEYRRHHELHISPELGRKSLEDIRREDVAALHRKMKDIPRAANFTLAVISSFMNWCEKQGLRPLHSNPVSGIKKYPERRRERFLSEDEIAALGNALDQEEKAKGGNIYAVAAIRLLLLTGARKNEILTLKWDYVDLDRGLILLPESKTGEKAIVVNQAARQVIESLPRQKDNPYVICGRNQGSHLKNIKSAWQRIRNRAGLDDVRIHDLRHTFASWAALNGASLPQIGAVLGHKQAQTTQRYAHLVPESLRGLVDSVGNGITTAMVGQKKTGVN